MARSVDTVNLTGEKGIERYANYEHEFSLWKDDEFSQPASVTNYTAELEFRDKPDGTLLFLATTENGYLAVISQSVVLSVPGAITGAWTFVSAQYDLFVISPTGKRSKVARGSVVVYPSITQL